MEKYTVLLVDDEEMVIQIIMKKIAWEKLGFSVIGYAENGVKGLEMVEECQPDVVVTDIRMPYMDGLEMSRRIKQEYPETKILVLTGFDEFEYAKEAIHLEVWEYILKPVNSMELTKILERLKEKLDQEIEEKRSSNALQKYYEESLPLLQADFFVSLIDGKIKPGEEERYLQAYNISLSGPLFCCIVLHTSSDSNEKPIMPVLLSASVQKLAREQFEENWKARCFSFQENTVLITQFEKESQISELTDACDRFCRTAYRVLGAVVTIGIGKVGNQIEEIPFSYKGARKAISYRSIYGTSKAINIAEVAPQESAGSDEASDDELSGLLKAIHFNAEEEIKKAAELYLKKISSSSKSMLQHQMDMMELVSAFYRFAKNNAVDSSFLSDNMDEVFHHLTEMPPQALHEWVIQAGLSLSRDLKSVRTTSRKSFVGKAIEYIRGNYSDETLSLDKICEELGVSNAYFSSVFKKETGKAFVEYLTDYRMKIASGMLLETNEKSYVIAQKAGYADPNYFSYVFKKQFGVSPSKYRTEYAEGKKE